MKAVTLGKGDVVSLHFGPPDGGGTIQIHATSRTRILVSAPVTVSIVLPSQGGKSPAPAHQPATRKTPDASPQ